MNTSTVSRRHVRTLAGPLALLVAMAGALPAYAAVSNTVTATGTPPTGPAVTDTATEDVDVIDDAPGHRRGAHLDLCPRW